MIDDPVLDDLLHDFCGRPRRRLCLQPWRPWVRLFKFLLGPSLG